MWKKRVFDIMQADQESSKASRVVEASIMSLIFLNIILMIVETFDIPQPVKLLCTTVEIVSLGVFTVEYLLRLWVADLLFPGYPKWKARLKYAFSFMAFIDLMAILPFYLPFLIPVDLRALRAVRVMRLFMLLKLNRYTHAFTTIYAVLQAKSGQLLSSIFIVSLLMLISSLIMYNIEHDVQPEAFQNALSALWWSVAAFTTVGYGDIVPITAAGKLVGMFISILGICLVAVPMGIISAGFIEHIDKEEVQEPADKKMYCPYCGKNIT